MKNLKLLQIQHNRKLRSILPSVWKPVVNLQLLVANNCAMKYIDGLGGISNQVQKYNKNSDELGNLTSVWLGGNPLVCTCETVPFLDQIGSTLKLDLKSIDFKGQKFRFKKELLVQSESECVIEDNSYKSMRKLKDIQGQFRLVSK